MVQNAIVKKVVREGVVQVSLMRQMECGLHCDGACEGCGQRPTQEILALASDPIGSKAGDVVEVEPASGHNISASVVVFLLPVVGLGAGYVLGQALFHLWPPWPPPPWGWRWALSPPCWSTGPSRAARRRNFPC